MAKVSFSKLELKKPNTAVNTISFNGIDIEVKQYLPTDDKLQLIVNVISNAADGNRFYNPIKVQAFFALEIMFTYTNLSFTETQKKDLSKLYDIMESNGLIEQIKNAIPPQELDNLYELLYHSLKNIYAQMNSAMAIVEAFAHQDIGDMTAQVSDLQQKLADPQNLSLLRDVVSKLD